MSKIVETVVVSLDKMTQAEQTACIIHSFRSTVGMWAAETGANDPSHFWAFVSGYMSSLGHACTTYDDDVTGRAAREAYKIMDEAMRGQNDPNAVMADLSVKVNELLPDGALADVISRGEPANMEMSGE